MDRLRYELRVLGWRALAPPLAIAAGCALIAVAITTLTQHGNAATLASFLTAGMEMLLPLAAAVVATTLPSQDASTELQLTLPTSFAGTTLRRYAVVLAWTGLVALLAASATFALHLWHVPAQVRDWQPIPLYLAAQLVWLAPLLWLAGMGLALALLLRSPVASAAVLGGIWLAESFAVSVFATTWLHPVLLFPTTFAPFVDFWLTNRLEVAATGLVLVPLSWLLLRNTEALLQTGAGQGGG